MLGEWRQGLNSVLLKTLVITKYYVLVVVDRRLEWETY